MEWLQPGLLAVMLGGTRLGELSGWNGENSGPAWQREPTLRRQIQEFEFSRPSAARATAARALVSAVIRFAQTNDAM